MLVLRSPLFGLLKMHFLQQSSSGPSNRSTLVWIPSIHPSSIHSHSARLSQHPHCHRWHRSQTSASPPLPLPPNVPSSPRAARRPHLQLRGPLPPVVPSSAGAARRLHCLGYCLPLLDEAYPYRLGDCGIPPCRTLITSCCKCPPTY